ITIRVVRAVTIRLFVFTIAIARLLWRAGAEERAMIGQKRWNRQARRPPVREVPNAIGAKSRLSDRAPGRSGARRRAGASASSPLAPGAGTGWAGCRRDASATRLDDAGRSAPPARGCADRRPSSR